MRDFAIGACVAAMLATAALSARPAFPQSNSMSRISEDYIRLVLALGQHDADYVDAYYGPPELKPAAKEPLDAIAQRAVELRSTVAAQPKPAGEIERLRHQYLERQLAALSARVRMLKGERLSFDQESKALYDAVAPTIPESHFQEIIGRLEKQFPGRGPLGERVDAFRREFVIPREKLDSVFQTAIRACRDRTVKHIELPRDEQFTVEYVTNKSWGGYNWYQGGFRSLIQVNTDLPIYIDRAIDLACHEGYPGHHVYNVLLEKHLVRDRGWKEFMVYPLFSPQSLIAEGTANYGIDIAFPGRERIEYERAVLFPAAGLDAARAAEYYEVHALLEQLSYAGNEAARRYIDGSFTREQAATWLERYALMSRERAAQRVRFIDQYRSYVINYNLGKDMVRRYVERTAKGMERGGAGTPGARPAVAAQWDVFARLLSSPRLPSGLQ